MKQEPTGIEKIRGSKGDSLSVVTAHPQMSDINHCTKSYHQILMNL